MRYGQRALDIVDDERLCVFAVARAGGGVAHMAHADIAVQAIETLLVEYLVYKAHVLVVIHLAFGALGVADGDAAAFLSAVLQGK